MSKQIEAIKLAKRWLERNTYGDEAVDVYDALCEALAEQPAESEPVAYKITGKLGVICSFHGGVNVKKGDLVYTSPPASRPWISITANTILNLMPESIPAEHDGALLEFARAIEEELKEKNT